MVYIRFLTFNILGVIHPMEFIIQSPVQSTGSIHNHKFHTTVNALLFMRNGPNLSKLRLRPDLLAFFRISLNFLQNELI